MKAISPASVGELASQPRPRRPRFAESAIAAAGLAFPLSFAQPSFAQQTSAETSITKERALVNTEVDDDAPTLRPDLNGFDELLKAAGLVKNLDAQTQPYPKMTMERLRSLTEPNREALALVKRGLERGGGIPSRMVAVNAAHRAEALRTLARLLSAEGAYAEKRERFEEAADSYANLIRLGTEMPKGGLTSDHAAGHSALRSGRSSLLRISPRLDSDQLKRVARRLEQIDRDREPIGQAIELDAKLNPPKPSFGAKVLRALGPSAARSVAETQALRQEYRFACLRETARHRILMAHLAIRAYQIERKAAPRDLRQLTPDYLEQVPQDPFREPAAPLSYRAGAAGFQIYSVGADRRDDQGAAASEKEGRLGGGDILLAPPPAFAER